MTHLGDMETKHDSRFGVRPQETRFVGHPERTTIPALEWPLFPSKKESEASPLNGTLRIVRAEVNAGFARLKRLMDEQRPGDSPMYHGG